MTFAPSALHRPERPDLELPPDYNASDLINALIDKLGITQKILAQHLNISRGAIGHYVRGRRKPDRHVIFRLKRLCDILLYDIDIEQLLL